MADEFAERQLKRGEQSAQKNQPKFQEAPTAAEAEAVTEAVLQGRGPIPGRLGAALRRADANSRALAVGQLQREHGNNFVQRLLAGAQIHSPSVQRQGPPPSPAQAPSQAAPAQPGVDAAGKQAVWNTTVVQPTKDSLNSIVATPPDYRKGEQKIDQAFNGGQADLGADEDAVALLNVMNRHAKGGMEAITTKGQSVEEDLVANIEQAEKAASTIKDKSTEQEGGSPPIQLPPQTVTAG